MQVSKYTYTNSQFPDELREISSPPKALYTLGNLPNVPLVAVVGTRKPTAYGKQMTYQIASDLARAGVGIVSGLALGLDTIAHTAALEAGGYTIAVMAHGLDQIYPATNRGLAQRILSSGGALISEYDKGTETFKSNFVARNRIVSGLSLAVVIPEADASSGSLITANFALEQNKLVMAVPGNVTSLRSAGPNNLIKSGAIAITSASDVLAALDLESALINDKPMVAKSAEEAKILGLLAEGMTNSQELIVASKLSASQFAHTISLMEITGKVRNLGAGTWIKR